MDAEMDVLEEIQRRVLWLSTNMIEHANHVRPNPDGVKVGGHQASCASMVTLMTALYLRHLDADDFVAVKPPCQPGAARPQLPDGQPRQVLADGSAPTADCRPTHRGPRIPAGWTSPPARWDSDPQRRSLPPPFATMSTPTSASAHRRGSSLSSVMPNWTRATCGSQCMIRPPTRLGSVTWIVDFNRQSLDRIVPDVRIAPGSRVRGRTAGTSSRRSMAAGAGPSSRSTARRPYATGSTRCQMSTTSRCSVWGRRSCRARFFEGAPRRWPPTRRTATTTVGRPGHRPRWP